MANALHALTALGQLAPQTHQVGPYRIEERFDVALASLAIRRGREADVEAAASAAGIPLPEPARYQAGSPYSSFWVAPEMWMVEAPFESHEDIVAAVKPVFGEAASVTEQTDAWVRFDLSAPDLAPLLEKLSNIDFRRAPDGYATRTVIEHMGCYLIRRAENRLSVIGARSSAAALWHALETAAHSAF